MKPNSLPKALYVNEYDAPFSVGILDDNSPTSKATKIATKPVNKNANNAPVPERVIATPLKTKIPAPIIAPRPIAVAPIKPIFSIAFKKT